MEYCIERYLARRVRDSERVLVTKDLEFFRPNKNNRRISKIQLEYLKRSIEKMGS